MKNLLRLPPALLIALVIALQGTPPDAQEVTPSGDGPEVIYYDWVDEESGELRGGIVEVQPQNPMHAMTAVPLKGSDPVTTIMDNGPSSNRIDVVFVGDGYTAGELGQYALDVGVILPVFFAEQPFDAYAPFFNVHRVDVTSLESGVDNDPQGVFRDTALDMTYWCGGTERLLCVNVNKAHSHALSAPEVDQILVLANSTKYGGAGYSTSNLGTLAGRNGSAIEIALHEFGHSFGDLADEYTYGGRPAYQGGEPGAANLSIFEAAEMGSLETKWHLWLGVPGAGTFEGGGYSLMDIYRPTNNSLMRNLGRPFQGINREHLIFKIYQTVRPIDDATPSDVCDPLATYSVTPVYPLNDTLSLQWFLDGSPIEGATGESFDSSSLALSPGPHTLSVEVVDTTSWVRDEDIRAALMTDTRSWNLSAAGLATDNPQGTNPSSYAVTGPLANRPVLGTSVDLTVNASGTTGHTNTVIIGFLGGLELVLGGGQVLLVDLAHPAGEILGLPVQAGDYAHSLAIPADPSLCNLEVYTQAVHLFGVAPFALSNRNVLTLGY